MRRSSQRLTRGDSGKEIVLRAIAQGDKDRDEISRLRRRIQELEKQLEETTNGTTSRKSW